MEENQSPKKKKYRLKTDTIIAVSAILISLCALIMTVVENNMMRIQQKASNYPHLILARGYNNEGFYITLQNKGPGLAFVKNFYIWTEEEDGTKTYFENWEDVANHFLPEGHDVTYSVIKTTTVNEDVMEGGESANFFKLPYKREDLQYEDEFIFTHIPKLKYKLCYCSILKDCWYLSYENFNPRACKSCKPDGNLEFDKPVEWE